MFYVVCRWRWLETAGIVRIAGSANGGIYAAIARVSNIYWCNLGLTAAVGIRCRKGQNWFPNCIVL